MAVNPTGNPQFFTVAMNCRISISMTYIFILYSLSSISVASTKRIATGGGHVLPLRFHQLVDQELAFDKKGGYRRVKAGNVGKTTSVVISADHLESDKS